MNSMGMDKCCCGSSLGITSIPIQEWKETFDLPKALQLGTLFPELHKPFYLGGDEKC